MHFRTVIDLEIAKKFPPAAGYLLQITFSAMIEAWLYKHKMVQQRARAINILFYTMIEARSCIGEIVQQCARAQQILMYAMTDARPCIGEMIQ